MTAWLRGERAALAGVLVVGLALRLWALGATGYPSDPVEVTRWALGMRQYGPLDFYSHIAGGYYPAVLYLLWPLAGLLSGDALYTAVKGLAIPFDLVTGVVLYLIGRHHSGPRVGVIAAGLFVLNPAAIVGGALWGQLDVIGALCMLLAVVALGERRFVLAGMAAVVGGMVKATFGAVALVIGVASLVEAYRSGDPRPPVKAIAGGLIAYALVGLGLRLTPWAYLDLVREGALRFAYTSLNAFNVWALVAGFFEPDDAYVRIGVGLLLVGLAATVVPLWWRRDTAALLAVAGAVVLAFYFLPTRVHDRYLYPAIVLFAPLAAARPRLRVPYILMSLAFAVTLLYSLWNGPSGHRLLPGGLDAIVFARAGVYATGIVLAGASGVLLWLLARGECTTVPAPGVGGPVRGAAALKRLAARVAAVHPLVVVVIVFNAIALWPELTSVPNLNDDAYHLQLVARAADAISRGQNPFDNWLPTLELGFPVFLYYQQLPHLAVVALSSLTFGAIDLRSMFDLIRYSLLVMLPLTVFVSLRWMGFSRTGAAAAGAAAALFSSDHRFGLEYDSYLWRGYGLYTQLWAVHLSFIAIAALYRLLHVSGRIVPAALAAAGVVLVHLVYGYMLAISAIVLALVGLGRSNARRRLLLLALTGVLVAAIAVYLVPPYVGGAQAFLDVSPYLPRYRWDSFGAPAILGWLVTGELFDHGRLPVLTALTAVGIAVAIVRRDRLGLTAVALFAVWLTLYFGRATYGPLADLLPFANGLPVHRFIGSVQIAAVMLIGVAADWVYGRMWALIPRRRRGLAAAAVAVLLLAPVLAERWSYAAVNRAWIEESAALVAADADAARVADSLAHLPPGRLYAGLRTNWGQSLDLGSSFRGLHLWDVLAARGFDMVRPPAFSFSLNSDLEFDFNDRRLADYQVFDARYVVAPPGVQLPSELRTILQTSRYVLYEAPTTGYAAYAAIVARERPASQADLLTGQRLWLASADPSAARYIRFDFPAPIDVAAPAGGCSRPAYEDERIAPGRIEVAVSCPEDATLVLKTTFHPNWRVTVDGAPQVPFMVSPSYLAVGLPAGRHVVVAEYRGSSSRVPLVIFGALIAGGLVVFRRQIERAGR
ncbi:MAG TPA: hypothetical protein VGT60_12000 [Candidatus Limnocylindria bacterium]|nr:hypothetical protein [Candidatus Limnocylindria bacterium]